MKTKRHFSVVTVRAQTAICLLSLTSLLAAAFVAAAASPSELLEQGIYSEETKGDLDTAVKLYQQVVTEAQAGQTLAAQAQYRLGVCFYKKKNYAEATTAFQKLIKDYPDEKDLVARASEYLSGAANLLPAPWVDGEELKFDIRFPTGFKIGMADLVVRAGETNGQKIWRLHSLIFAGVVQLSQVEADADSFKPLHSRWKHTLIGDADTVYSTGRAEVTLVGKTTNNKKIDLTGVVYDNEEAIQLMRRLPLATNYSITLRVLSSLSGGMIVPFKAEVAAQEKVTVPAGMFDCYKVELSIHQTFWYTTDEHHYLIKFEAGGAVCELASIGRSKPNEPVRYQDPAFSLTAPPDWLFYRPEVKEAKTRRRVIILDPEGLTADARIENLDAVKPEAKKSVRAFAESLIAEEANERESKVRPDSWQERTVAGQPGLSFIADFDEGQEKKVAYRVCSLGKTNAVLFNLEVSPRDFEAMRPKFDALIDSYKPN